MTSAESPFTLSCFDGTDVVAVMEVYSDASEIGDHLAIGALLFRKKDIKPFEKKWRAMLRKYDIAFFHMTDCNASPPRGPFKGKTEGECDDCAREAIAIILEFAKRGAIFAVSKSDFNEIIGERGMMPNPFTMCAWWILFDIAAWAEANDPIARISYIFEAGDDHQKDANTMLDGVAENPERVAMFRYRNHAFLPKRITYPAQAADILAWHGAKHLHRRTQGNYRLRGDFDAIISKLHVTDGNLDRQRLKDLVGIATERGGKYGNELVGLAFRATEANLPRVTKQFMEVLAREGDREAGLKDFLERAGIELPPSLT
jgi:hypothetical protein